MKINKKGHIILVVMAFVSMIAVYSAKGIQELGKIVPKSSDIQNEEVKNDDGRLSDQEVREKFKAKEVIINDSPNCIDFVPETEDIRLSYQLISDGEPLPVFDNHGDYVIYNDYENFGTGLVDDYVGVCNKLYLDKVFTDSFFVDRFINTNKLGNMKSVLDDYNNSHMSLSPEQTVFLIMLVNSNYKFRSYQLSDHFFDSSFSRRCSDGEACVANTITHAQDIPSSAMMVKKAVINGDKSFVDVINYPWSRTLRCSLVMGDGGWKLIKTESLDASSKPEEKEVKSGLRLDDTWSYSYIDDNSTGIDCGKENVLLTNSKTGEQVYVFDEDKDYGKMSCLGYYFKFDRKNQVLYFVRSYEFCMGTYYSFDLKTKALTEMKEQSEKKVTPEGAVDFDIEEAMKNGCFTAYFQDFELLSGNPEKYPVEDLKNFIP